MKILILEARVLKRCSKKVKTEYMPLTPGEIWLTVFKGQRISVGNDKDNTSTLYVGQRK